VKNLYKAAAVVELKVRLAHLQPESQRQWGKMTPAQALAHYSAQMEMVLGGKFTPHSLRGRIFGRFAKGQMLGGKPLPRNLPTDACFIVNDERDLDLERMRLHLLIDRFVATGHAGCTKNPHSFLGRMTPVEWATLMYKHLDHHLRQFGV
jgi:transposase InsO family protein